MELHDRVVLVTGARRIGSSVAEALAQKGADIALSYRRSETEARRAASAVERHGRRAVVISADLSDAEACRRLVEQAVRDLGRLDVLICMASTYVQTPLDDLTHDDLDRALSVDVRGAYLCALAAIPHLRASGGGRIVNFADWVARSGRPRYRGFLPYFVAQSAVIGLTEALALELAPDGILVNAVAPGPIRPPAEMSDEDIQEVADVTPLGRWGGDPAIVQAVVALIESDFITGETIRVDGGRHLK